MIRLEGIAAHEDYLEIQSKIEMLVGLDPEPDSAEGRELTDLVRLVERYEKTLFTFETAAAKMT